MAISSLLKPIDLMKKILATKTSRWFSAVILVFISFFLLVLIAAHVMLYHVEGHQDQLIHWAEQQSGHPVKIEKITTSWRGLKPVFILNKVSVLTNDKKRSIWNAEQLLIKINLLKSLVNLQVEPGSIEIVGSSIALKQQKNGQILINDWQQFTLPTQTLFANTQLSPAFIWLLSRDSIVLRNINIQWIGKNGETLNVIDLTAELKAASQLRIVSGQIDLINKKLFKNKLHIDHLSGDFTWARMKDFWEIHASSVSLKTPDIQILGKVDLQIPQNLFSTTLKLVTHVSVKRAEKLANYLPYGVLSSEAGQWLSQAFSKGVVEADVNFDGPLASFPFGQQQSHFFANVNFKNLNLRFDHDWPMLTHVNGLAIFSDRSLTVNVKSGKILNIPFNKVTANIPDLAHPILKINGLISSSLKSAWNLIQNSPLREHLGKDLDDVIFAGPAQLDLQLMIPLGKGTPPLQASGKLDFQHDQIELPVNNLVLKKVTGSLQFIDDHISGDNIYADMIQQPLVMSIKTLSTTDKDASVEIVAHGQMPIENFLYLFDVNDLDFLSGATNYQVILNLYHNGDSRQNHLTLVTDLHGVKIDTPSPLGKKSDELAPFKLEMTFGGDHLTNMSFNYNEKLTGAFSYQLEKTKFLLQSGELRLGDGVAQLQKKLGLLIDGDISQYAWKDWGPYLLFYLGAPVSNAHNSNSFLSKIREIAFTTDHLNIFNQKIDKAKISVRPKNDFWAINIVSSAILGEILVPVDYKHKVWQGIFDRLYLTPIVGSQTTSIKPRDLPALRVSSSDFKYNDKTLGRLELSTTPYLNGLKINQLQLAAPLFNVSLSGTWYDFPKSATTHLQGTFASSALGSVVKSWGITKKLTGGSGQSKFNLYWSGAPHQFNWSGLNGDLTFEFLHGQIIDVGEKTDREIGFGKILNLLSLQNLPHRLASGFSDLAQKGFPFDIVAGSFLIKNGTAVIQKMQLDGNVAKAVINGKIGLLDQSYDLKMIVTPYVTSSAPIVATILGGPIVGAATWAASKILSPAVDKLTSHTYQVTGTWSNPTVSNVVGP